MALDPCPECGKTISTGAEVCPHCGKRLKMTGCMTIIFAMVVLLAIVVVFGLLKEAFG